MVCKQRLNEMSGLANNVHVQDVQNGVVVDGVRGDLCHSSRTVAFCTNSNINLFCITSNNKRCGGLRMVLGRSEVP